MGLKLVEIAEDVAKELPTCVSGSQALMVIEGADLIRSRGVWATLPTKEARLVLRSLDDSPLLIATKQEPNIGIGEARPGEQVAWGELKGPEAPFVPGAITIEPLQFIAGTMVRIYLGDKAAEITLFDDRQEFVEGDEPSSCNFEAGSPAVQFGFVPNEWLTDIKPLDFN